MNDYKVLSREESYSFMGGTSFRDKVEADYYDLKEIFGPPSTDDEVGEKVSVEWILDLGDRYLTIYDWKHYSSHTAKANCTHWHIGGRPEDSLDALDLKNYILKKVKSKR